MDATTTEKSTLGSLRDALESGTLRSARRMIAGLRPGEVARLLESLPVTERRVVWELVDRDIEGEVLVELADEVRDGLLQSMNPDQVVAATGGMAVDDLADLIVDLPEAITAEVLKSLDGQERERLREVLAYPENSAGGLMDTDTISIRADVSIEVVLRYLRAHAFLPDRTDLLFVVDRDDRLLGALPITRLLVADPSALVDEYIERGDISVKVMTESNEIVRQFEDRDLLSVAVVDDDNRLVGRITVDDVMDVVRDEAEHSIMGAAGLDEDFDLFAPVFQSARRRAVWLGINLLTAFLAASVVDLFEATIDQVVLLAVLMPVVPSMGGVAGTQTLTIITRALALGQIERSNAISALRRELSVGILNGVFWALLVAVVTAMWFKTWIIGLLIAVAMACNLFVAAFCGFMIPMALKRLNIDPALAGGVVLTTITDVVGYGVFLGLGAWLLL
ncbi:MAG: magnesium transporter [Pseudomonadota bacterium]